MDFETSRTWARCNFVAMNASCGEQLIASEAAVRVGIERGWVALILNALSVLTGHVGDFDRIKRFVKILGLVACTTDFRDPPKGIDDASLLLYELFAESGIAARSAIGTNQ